MKVKILYAANVHELEEKICVFLDECHKQLINVKDIKLTVDDDLIYAMVLFCPLRP